MKRIRRPQRFTRYIIFDPCPPTVEGRAQPLLEGGGKGGVDVLESLSCIVMNGKTAHSGRVFP